jgi:hypothetical protein
MSTHDKTIVDVIDGVAITRDQDIKHIRAPLEPDLCHYCKLELPKFPFTTAQGLAFCDHKCAAAKNVPIHKPSGNDLVNHPKHYTNHPSGIECIEVTRHMGFNTGNAIKYLWRADEKGAAIQDLRKAIWYIEDEIKKREGKPC